MKLEGKEILISDEELEALQNDGFSHFCIPSDSAFDRLVYAVIPAWSRGRIYDNNFREHDLTDGNVVKALAVGFDCLTYESDGFIPSYALTAAVIFDRAGNPIPIMERVRIASHSTDSPVDQYSNVLDGGEDI